MKRIDRDILWETIWTSHGTPFNRDICLRLGTDLSDKLSERIWSRLGHLYHSLTTEAKYAED